MRERDVTIIVACYRDAPHLEHNTREIVRVMNDTVWDWELVLVNDKSPDECGQIIDSLVAELGADRARAIHHEVNQGRGAAVMSGLRAARGKVAGFLDIDLEAHARYLPSLIREVMDGADVAVAHRIYRVQLAILHRVVLSRGYLWLVNKALGTDFADTESGYKIFRRDRIIPVLEELQSHGWFWDTEIMARAQSRGLKLASVPVLFLRNPQKRSTVRIVRDVYDYFVALWKFRREMRMAAQRQELERAAADRT